MHLRVVATLLLVAAAASASPFTDMCTALRDGTARYDPLAAISRITFNDSDMIVAGVSKSYPLASIRKITFGEAPVRRAPGHDTRSDRPRAAARPALTAHALRFTLERPERISACVYDLRGRLVVRLVDRTYPAGSHTLRWHRAAGSNGTQSACYIIRANIGARAVSERLVRGTPR